MNDYEENFQYSDFEGDSHALDREDSCPQCGGKMELIPESNGGQMEKCLECSYIHQYEK